MFSALSQRERFDADFALEKLLRAATILEFSI